MTLENLAFIHLNFKQKGQTLGNFVKMNYPTGIANSANPDQTALSSGIGVCTVYDDFTFSHLLFI